MDMLLLVALATQCGLLAVINFVCCGSFWSGVQPAACGLGG